MNIEDVLPSHPSEWPELLKAARDPKQRAELTPFERQIVADLEAGRRKLPRGQPQSYRVLRRKQALAEDAALLQATGEKYIIAIQMTADANGITPAAVEKAIRDFKKWRGAARWERIKERYRRLVAELKAEGGD